MGQRGRKKQIGSVQETGRPQAPSGLDSVAKRAWASLCDDLEEQGTLVRTDRKLIELYAKTYSLWHRTTEQLASESLTLGSADRKFINPLANLYNNLESRLHKILLDCGLSPQTRKAQPTGTEDTRTSGSGDI